MNALQVMLDEYLGVRRALGAQMRDQGHLLQQFVEFAAQEDAALTTKLKQGAMAFGLAVLILAASAGLALLVTGKAAAPRRVVSAPRRRTEVGIEFAGGDHTVLVQVARILA